MSRLNDRKAEIAHSLESYSEAYRRANGKDMESSINYENGWVVFRDMSGIGFVHRRVRMIDLLDMRATLLRRAAQSELIVEVAS